MLVRAVCPHFSEGMLRAAGRATRALFRGRPRWRGIVAQKVFVPRSDGTSMAVYVFRAKRSGARLLPVLIWFHGGGYAMGSPLFDRKMIRDFVLRGGAVVFAPCYTQSTEAPYPAAADDAVRALEYVREAAALFGADRERISVGGESAGGGLALSLALRARDEGLCRLECVLPVYPMLDDRPRPYNDGPLWNTKSNRAAWALYLSGARADKYAAPSRETNWENLPPSATFIGSLDPFLEETFEAAGRARGAGGTFDVRVMEGCCHGFDFIPCSRAGGEARAYLLSKYREFLGGRAE